MWKAAGLPNPLKLFMAVLRCAVSAYLSTAMNNFQLSYYIGLSLSILNLDDVICVASLIGGILVYGVVMVFGVKVVIGIF